MLLVPEGQKKGLNFCVLRLNNVILKHAQMVLFDINAKTDLMFCTLEIRARIQAHSHHDRQSNPLIAAIDHNL